MQTVLFICTGNYYRSRYAELLFNAQQVPGWCADSRGLRLSSANLGPIWPLVLDRLRQHGFSPPLEVRWPLALCEEELVQAALVVALDETEHRPLMQQRFPMWVDRIRYWQTPDLPALPAEVAFHRIEQGVQALINELQTR
ncbi:MAG: low molecular weight phosphatase family protein [Chloroflexus aggregans]|uniref:Low molecular weight phosphatase family protein n=1 Tax=Chloroflexus aggregans TaxID=152260 RepID=A0A2J6X331_9CHLR|nr:MAG: low molecular weight phosphatase family protein [Chloroflexus aggregans]